MALLERVGTLLRANLNDLIDKAEDPEKMIKQLILDMQNQLLQVKTSVAITIAEQHALEKSQKDNADKHAEWTRKAELAVDKGQSKVLAADHLDLVAPFLDGALQLLRFVTLEFQCPSGIHFNCDAASDPRSRSSRGRFNARAAFTSIATCGGSA